jgi:hypothetical protein
MFSMFSIDRGGRHMNSLVPSSDSLPHLKRTTNGKCTEITASQKQIKINPMLKLNSCRNLRKKSLIKSSRLFTSLSHPKKSF